jgi:hypothetical protein
MATRMQQRRGTAAQWTAANPTLAAGEIGFETDTNKFKLGNGSTAWTSLAYFVDASIVFDSSEVQGLVDTAVSNLIDGAPNTLNTLNELAAAIADDQSYSAYVANAFSTQGTRLTNLEGNVTAIITTATALANTVSTNSSNTTSELSTLSNNLTTHANLSVNAHGISNTAALVYTSDARLTDSRTPTDGSVSEGKIASSAVTSAKIADDAVTSAKILDSAVTSAKIAANTIVNSDINSEAAIDQSKVANLTSDLSAKLASADASSTYAPLVSAALTGTPTAPTANTATNTTQIATTAFVQQEIAILTDSAPGLLNTLDELAAALGDDANFAATTANAIALKAPLSAPTFTGLVTVAASGIAFTDGTQTKEGVPSRTPIISKTASYELTATSERDSLIEVNSGSATTITIPTNSSVAFPVGTTLDILQTGSGQVTIAGAGGVTVNATPGFKLRTQWSSATLFKRAENSWVAFGDLTA